MAKLSSPPLYCRTGKQFFSSLLFYIIWSIKVKDVSSLFLPPDSLLLVRSALSQSENPEIKLGCAPCLMELNPTDLRYGAVR